MAADAGTGVRFDRTSPVTRYWLARCEGFAVRGATRGVVEELVHDGDPFAPTALVVRRRRRRRRVDAAAVAAVVPAERLVVVERLGPRAATRLQSNLVAGLELVAGAATRLRRNLVAELEPVAGTATTLRRNLVAGLEPVAASFRRLAAELLGTTLLLRSAPWRRFARSARSATTFPTSRRWSRRRTT